MIWARESIKELALKAMISLKSRRDREGGMSRLAFSGCGEPSATTVVATVTVPAAEHASTAIETDSGGAALHGQHE